MPNEDFSGHYNINYYFGIALSAMKNISSSWRKNNKGFSVMCFGIQK